jgi:flavin reductase (DIM6/NTAB) family NADH-FMN oxidoreductase RutF
VQFDISNTDAQTAYHALVGVVTPRPIAWVTSIDSAGRVNLAPFSFFNTFGGHPPIVVFAPNRRPDGSKKDTLANVEATREFVINLAVADLSEQVNLSSQGLPKFDNELERLGLTTLPSVKIKPPRLRESPIHLECVLRQVLQFGEGVESTNMVIGEVVLIHVDDAMLDERSRIDPHKVQTIGRLGGNYYCRTSDLFEIRRPPDGVL